MQLTKGSVSVTNTGASWGTALKNIISAMVQVIPGLSIKEVTTDTASVYNVTLSYRGLELKFRNNSDSLYWAFGNGGESSDPDTIEEDTLANIYYLYNVSSGVFSVKCVYPQRTSTHVWGFSVIPITVTLAGGGTKELLFGLYSAANVGASTFSHLGTSEASIYRCYDPSTGNVNSFAINTPGYQFPGKTGNTVVIPRIFSCDYGEVTSYEVNGGQFYVIYPGCDSLLADNYYGILPVFVGSVQYICVGDGIWMLA